MREYITPQVSETKRVMYNTMPDAGGVGFMMLFVPPIKRLFVNNALSQYNGQISYYHFEEHGSEAWTLL